MTSSVLEVTSTAEYIFGIISITATAHPSYNIRTQRGVKRQCTLTYIIYLRGVGRLGGKSNIGGIERAQDEIDKINTNGRVREVFHSMCLQYAESAFDGYNGRGRFLFSVRFRFFFYVGKQEEEHMHRHARVARLHKLQHPNTQRCEATVHHNSRWREMGRLGG